MTSTPSKSNYEESLPDARGRFGPYGGKFVPETLMAALSELEKAFDEARQDDSFWAEFEDLLTHYVGRPSAMYSAKNLTEKLGGAQIYIKREDLNHTGAHKINNAIGQALLAKRLGKKRIIAETGAGMHGVATATVCAQMGLECIVYMGDTDIERQSPNVYRMRELGAKVEPVTSGSRTLKDATNEAIRDWVSNVENTHYIIGSVVGPHPYPKIVRDFQAVIGAEARQQMLDMTGRLPDYVIACVGGGSNAMGIFSGFQKDESVGLIGVEASGEGLDKRHAATMSKGRPGVLHGSMSYLLHDEHGQVTEAHSISAGLDYPGVGPEHSYLKDTERATYVSATDDDALAGFRFLSQNEGIIPALEPSHAIGYMMKWIPTLPKDQIVLLLLSGRGDKDLDTVAKASGVDLS
jgi:tryptophan synthase beta subunit